MGSEGEARTVPDGHPLEYVGLQDMTLILPATTVLAL